MATNTGLENSAPTTPNSRAKDQKLNLVTNTATTTTTTRRNSPATQDGRHAHENKKLPVESHKHRAKRSRTSHEDPRATGPSTVTVITKAKGKHDHSNATIHTRPSKRPRTSHNQTHLYLDPHQKHRHRHGLAVKPAYRNSTENAALGVLLSKWMTVQILGSESEIDLKVLDKVSTRSASRFEGILMRFNPSNTAVFLAMYYIERGVAAGLSFRSGFGLNLSMKAQARRASFDSGVGPTVQQLVLYNVWIFLVALLVAMKVICSERVALNLWVKAMHLEGHHIETMHRQFVMMLDDQLTVPLDSWQSFVGTLALFNVDLTTHSVPSSRGTVADILADENRGDDTSHSKFIVHASLATSADEALELRRAPEDIQHVATVLAILLTHTINVTFDRHGTPSSSRRAPEAKKERTPQRVAQSATTKVVPAPIRGIQGDQTKAKSERGIPMVARDPVFTPPTVSTEVGVSQKRPEQSC